jgi:hypothetical protein
MTSTGTGATHEAAEQLGALADNLRARGFSAEVTQADQYWCVRVDNLGAPTLAETVCAAPVFGAWWFWWSSGDPIARLAEVETAAFKIAYVLTPQSDV